MELAPLSVIVVENRAKFSCCPLNACTLMKTFTISSLVNYCNPAERSDQTFEGMTDGLGALFLGK
jgi:hypothetical protein